MTKRHIDPEPITIFTAIVAAFSASVASVNYVKTHHKALPTKARAKVLTLLGKLDDQVRHLRADANIVKGIFAQAKFSSDRRIRLGNGAHLTSEEFGRYEIASDAILRQLRAIHKLSLKMERATTKLDPTNKGAATNVLGEVYSKLEALLESRNLTIDSAWRDLDAIADGLERAIESLRKQLSSG